MARPKAAVPTVHVTPKPPYTAYWFSDGKMVQRGCAAPTRDEAIEIAARKFQEWLNPPAPAAYTVGQLIDAYLADKTADMTEDERKAFLYNWTHVRPFFASYTPTMLTPKAWKAYKAHRGAMCVNNAGSRSAKVKVAKPIAESTIKRELNALRGAIGWGNKHGWAGLPPKIELEGFVESTDRHVFLTRPEFDKLLDVLKETPHLQLFCMLSVATGARMSAVLELTWENVSMSMDDILKPLAGFDMQHFKPKTKPGPIVRTGFAEGHAPISNDGKWGLVVPTNKPIVFNLGRGRGNKKRGSGYVGPESKRLYGALWDAYRNRGKSGFVIEWRGNNIKSVDLSDAFERAKTPAAKRTQHVLKHTCCSWARQGGISWRDLSSLTGTSEETLKRHYGHIASEQLARASAAVAV